MPNHLQSHLEVYPAPPPCNPVQASEVDAKGGSNPLVSAEVLASSPLVRGVERLRKMVDAFSDDQDVRDALDHLETLFNIYIQRGTILTYPPTGHSLNTEDVSRALAPFATGPKYVSITRDEAMEEIAAIEKRRAVERQRAEAENEILRSEYEKYRLKVIQEVTEPTAELPKGVPPEFAWGEMLTFDQFVERVKEQQ